jgi:hypothetical protein
MRQVAEPPFGSTTGAGISSTVIVTAPEIGLSHPIAESL